MRRFWSFLLVFLMLGVVFLLMGCSEKLYPVMEAATDGAPKVTQQVADSSVSKESVVHVSLQNRDIQYRKAYEESGLKLTWKEFTMKFKLPGMTDVYEVSQMMPEIEFRESPKFDQPLPTEPSEHPVWKFANNVVDKTLIGWGFDRLAYVLHGSGGRQYYAGDYSPNYQNPVNTGDGTLTFTPGMLNRDGGYQPYEAPVFSPRAVEPVAVAEATPAE
ncbi:MAG: hypothetical protein KQH59_18435 [Desulfobulbaceae bacterium]|nr:hypothetical protein [Desulfobulbaceae bacterium]